MEPNPNEEAFKNIFEGMAKFVNAESVKFFEKLYAESGLPDKFEGVNHFHRKVIYPHQKFVRGLLIPKFQKTKISIFFFKTLCMWSNIFNIGFNATKVRRVVRTNQDF